MAEVNAHAWCLQNVSTWPHRSNIVPRRCLSAVTPVSNPRSTGVQQRKPCSRSLPKNKRLALLDEKALILIKVFLGDCLFNRGVYSSGRVVVVKCSSAPHVHKTPKTAKMTPVSARVPKRSSWRPSPLATLLNTYRPPSGRPPRKSLNPNANAGMKTTAKGLQPNDNGERSDKNGALRGQTGSTQREQMSPGHSGRVRPRTVGAGEESSVTGRRSNSGTHRRLLCCLGIHWSVGTRTSAGALPRASYRQVSQTRIIRRIEKGKWRGWLGIVALRIGESTLGEEQQHARNLEANHARPV